MPAYLPTPLSDYPLILLMCPLIVGLSPCLSVAHRVLVGLLDLSADLFAGLANDL